MKINCPSHEDTTPSMHVYQSDTGYVGFCFVCRARTELTKDQVPTGLVQRASQKQPTGIQRMVSYIGGLPVKLIRGLLLPYDDYGYYFTWRNGSYYKRRNWVGKQRYDAPRGAKPPLYMLENLVGRRSNLLVIVEGELNAISLRTVIDDPVAVCSPGSATEFMRHYSEYLKYKRIMIVCDFDAAAVVYAHQLKQKLLSAGKHVSMNPVHKDFNQALQDGGPLAVIEQFKKLVG